jgi:epoxyqueuosine reductase
VSTTLTSNLVKARASELGFDLCGVAAAEPFPELAFLEQWLARGYAGEMAWMVRTAERRANIQAVLPGARSVVVTGTLYNADRPYSSTAAADVARISRYAWGDDYHDVIKRRLDDLLAWMRANVVRAVRGPRVRGHPAPSRSACTRSMPASAGWGRTPVSSTRSSVVVFLAVIVSTCHSSRTPKDSSCAGSCTPLSRCVPDRCAGGAGVLDRRGASRISPSSIAAVCRAAPAPASARTCTGATSVRRSAPTTGRRRTTSDRRGSRARSSTGLALVDLWRLADDQLRRRVKGSAMTRAKLTGLRRNVAVAIGNSGDADALAALDEPVGERSER